MANVTVITGNVAGAPAVLLDARLTADGHTSNIVDESTVTGGAPESTKDLLICVDNTENNTTLRDNLNTLMTTHSVPVMICWGQMAGTFSTTHLACLLGIVANLRTVTEDGSDYVFTNNHQDEGATDAWEKGTAITIASTAEPLARQATATTDQAGASLLADSSGRSVLNAVQAAGAKTLAVGGTFDTKILFAGFLSGTNGWEPPADILFRTCVSWCLDVFDVGFPT